MKGRKPTLFAWAIFLSALCLAFLVPALWGWVFGLFGYPVIDQLASDYGVVSAVLYVFLFILTANWYSFRLLKWLVERRYSNE